MKSSTILTLSTLAIALSAVFSPMYAQNAASPTAAPAITTAQPSSPAAPGTPSGAPTAAPQPPSPVEVVKVTSATVVEDVSATGTVKANESVMLRPEIVGRVNKLNFRDGEKVCRNQILVELDTSIQKANKDQALAELSLAVANFKRNEDLAAQKFISTAAKDTAESQVQVAQAKLALAEAQLQRGLIRAPFTGIVGLRNVSVGEYVKDGTDLVTLDDLTRVRIDFKMPERYAAQVKLGQKVLVEPDAALRLKDLAGKVDAIDSVLDTNGRSLTLRSRLPNPRGVLKPGMFVKTKLILSERKGALMVPDESVIAQGRDTIVYKVVDGKAVRAVVKTGVRQMGKIELREGVVEGDVVIQAGLQRINRDGQAVRVVEARPPGQGGAGGGAGQGQGQGQGPQGQGAAGQSAAGQIAAGQGAASAAAGAKSGAAAAPQGKPPAGKPPAGRPPGPAPTEKICDDDAPAGNRAGAAGLSGGANVSGGAGARPMGGAGGASGQRGAAPNE